MEIHERIRALREQKCYTQTCVGRRIGMSASNYGALENGTKRIFVDELDALCKIYGKSPEYFMYGFTEDTLAHYYVRLFNDLELEDQMEVLHFIEFRRQLREELESQESSFNKLLPK